MEIIRVTINGQIRDIPLHEIEQVTIAHPQPVKIVNDLPGSGFDPLHGKYPEIVIGYAPAPPTVIELKNGERLEVWLYEKFST